MKRLLSSAQVLLRTQITSGLRRLHTQATCCSINSETSNNHTDKLVIFDKDGTLTCIHTMWSKWCEEYASRMENATGKKISDDIFDFLAYDKETRRLRLGNMAEKTHPVLKDDLKKLLVAEHGLENHEAHSIVDNTWLDSFEVEETCVTHKVKAIGDVKKLFHTLRENGFKIAVCTSDSRASTEAALEAIGVSDMVDRLLCGNDPDNTAKPATDNVYLLCKELGVKVEDTVMIGDTPTDTVMGQLSKCGLVIGVLSGVGSETDLSDAHHIVDNVEDALPLILEKLSPGSTHPSVPLNKGSPTQRSARMFSTRAFLRPVSYTEMLRKSYSTSAKHSKEFTHIIVGAGSAGCVLASRLTENPENSVLLLEAGPKDTILNSMRMLWKIHMPAALTYNLCDDRYNWYYHTTPQKHVNNRVMYCPRGRVWGGSSSLNAMVYIRGHAYDYDRWQAEGAMGWDYDHCLPYFKKAQNHQLGADTYRGGDGPLNVTRGDTSGPLYQAFIEGGQQAGYPYTPDLNGFQQEGVGPMDMTVHKGYRWSAATAYLRPALERENLHTEKVKKQTSC